ncbi:carbamate kinase (plasmid) [Arthrobacter sp. TES]|jgi:carbamate kinase|uniref:Carbamate kinase n=3 Tax=Bacteria TaxID=2 RepID=Q6SKC5_PAEAU|nr:MULTISPECIES: carbamate kinase [Bacteria]AAS20047.1 carbamoyl phosphate synthetase-like protein [Paenarthrobacter aurescens]ABM10307.1 Carbamoyl phosphate synthetase-like protein [Paenarthrobacter aurescens TC1]QOI65889.1 carbamate kinase [Arthrobacter sp. TES]WLE00978.1 carbamate kinase [Agrobacterium leguminum]
MGKSIVIAFGGNAITKENQKGTFQEQVVNIKEMCSNLVDLIKNGYHLVLTHGNGPQVGNILIKNELSKSIVPAMPLDVCVSNTQGSLGYAIQQELTNVLVKDKAQIPVVTVVTRVKVDIADPAFQNPTKPVGPFYSENEAKNITAEKGYVMIEDSGRGWRRVVPSPLPLEILEKEAIHYLLEGGTVVIAAGGGGIPVYLDDNGNYTGVEAVIDKDLAGQQLARDVGAETFVILTGVSHVAINYGKESQKELDTITVSEGRRYQQEGHFPPGSMGPKMEAALLFVENGGHKSIITSPE